MMRTDDLINALSADAHTQSLKPIWLYAGMGALLLLGWTLYLYLGSGMGVRAEYWHAVLDPMVAAKQIMPIFLVLALIPYLRLLRYPEVRFSTVMIVPVVFFVLVMIGLFVLAWISTPPSLRGALIQGSSQMKCLITIPIYSWIVTGFVFYALKSTAPSNPGATAFLTALFSSALATVVYALGCVEDSPLFYALWYSVAMFGASLLAGLIGARYLKW